MYENMYKISKEPFHTLPSVLLSLYNRAIRLHEWAGIMKNVLSSLAFINLQCHTFHSNVQHLFCQNFHYHVFMPSGILKNYTN